MSLFVVLTSCQSLKPEEITVASYPEIDVLFKRQTDNFFNQQLEKEVWLDGNTEKQNLHMDTSLWKKELSFLNEINPNQPAYAGVFSETKENNAVRLQLNSGEKGALSKFFYQKSGNHIDSIMATIYEDKDIYVYHKDIYLKFSKGLLTNFTINGYQKIMLKDTIRFTVKGKVL